MFEYDTLRLIWWGLIGALLIGFMITDGFDMGVGALLPILGQSESDKRVMINSIAPHWDGNQVWLITAGGALFAAWPLVYATSFSSLYIAMYLILLALWLRPLALEYRAKIDTPFLAKNLRYLDFAFRFNSSSSIWCRLWEFNARITFLAQCVTDGRLSWILHRSHYPFQRAVWRYWRINGISARQCMAHAQNQRYSS